VSILLTGDDRLRELNHDFRGQNRTTNVLSFPAGEPVPTLRASGVFPLGDIAVALETAAREARVEGKTLDDHLMHLIVHGTLHLLGYDHEQDAEEAERMERREVEILAGLGVADPYRVEAAA
jgi:probable rRNA maturation factor